MRKTNTNSLMMGQSNIPRVNEIPIARNEEFKEGDEGDIESRND
jgi:hypothetical protein